MHRQLRHSEQLSGLVGTLQKSRFPYVNQGPAVQAGLSKYRDLRLAMFTFLPTEFLLTDFFLIVFILTLFTKEYFACCIKVQSVLYKHIQQDKIKNKQMKKSSSSILVENFLCCTTYIMPRSSVTLYCLLSHHQCFWVFESASSFSYKLALIQGQMLAIAFSLAIN